MIVTESWYMWGLMHERKLFFKGREGETKREKDLYAWGFVYKSYILCEGREKRYGRGELLPRPKLGLQFLWCYHKHSIKREKNLLFPRKDFVEGTLFSAPSYISANRRRDSTLQISFCHKEGYILGSYWNLLQLCRKTLVDSCNRNWPAARSRMDL